MANKVDNKNFANYLAEARSWETNKVRDLEKSRKLAWIAAACASVLTMLSVFALAMLTPLKTAIPYIIRVDNSTGAVDVVTALKDGKTTYDEALNKYNLQWYVKWRESYSKNLLEDYYKNVGIMSSPEEQLKYGQWLSKKNPNSPIKVYGNYSNVIVTIKSVSFIQKNVASVRYTKEVTDEQNGLKVGVTHWVATIVFHYVGTPMSEQDRAVNPLGFQVIEYRNDPDQAISESEQILPAAKPRQLYSLPQENHSTTPAAPNPVVPPIE